MSQLLSVQNIGKCFKVYASESRRVASWFGLPINSCDEHWTIRHASFNLNSGESLGIVGANGAGKSTLLKIIAGTLKETEGNIKLNGSISAILELGMGFNPELTGRQNAIHSLGIMGHNNKAIIEIIPEVEKFAEIGEYFDEPVRTYSSGMQVRVAYAVATAYQPDLLIVDEALSVGDIFFQAKCFDHIKLLKKQGTTLILVTHSMDQIVKHCDRAIYIKNGTIELDGSPTEISNVYTADLVSKHKQKNIDLDTTKLQSETLNLSNGPEDNFSTRPGYRKEEYKWGEGGADIIDFLININSQSYPAIILSNSLVEFSFKVIFNEDYDDVIPGIIIKTLDGIVLYGTNSFLLDSENHPIPSSKGSVRVFKFKISLTLNTGQYLVSFGISSGPHDKLKNLNKRYDSVIINVDKSPSLLGIVDLMCKFKLKA
jgi:lipopolysaccharide transport system ATP-binding protein